MAEPPNVPEANPVGGSPPQPPTKPPPGVKWKGEGKYPNPPDAAIPDAATLREQWRYAVRQYSRWYSLAWGTAILAGLSFFSLGWLVKGSNPLPSRAQHHEDDHKDPDALQKT